MARDVERDERSAEERGVAIVCTRGRFQPGSDPRRNTKKPGPGRPPSAVRASFREVLDGEALPFLTEILNDVDAPLAARLKAAEIIAQYSGTKADTDAGTAGRRLVVVFRHERRVQEGPDDDTRG